MTSGYASQGTDNFKAYVDFFLKGILKFVNNSYHNHGIDIN